MHFGRVLRRAIVSLCDFNNTDNTKKPVLELPTGSREILHLSLEGGSYISTNRWRGDCSSGWLEVKSPDGTRYKMDVAGPLVGTTPTGTQSSWYPSLITDRNGNTMTITYTGSGLTFGPATVTTSDGRSLTFTYDSGRLASVSDGARTWTYTVEPIPGYDGGYHLTKVTRPDGAFWSYEYNPPGQGPGQGTPGGFSMKTTTYPTGGVVNYTYGFVNFNSQTVLPTTTVVTQKVAGPDTWQYAYTPAINPLPQCGDALCPIDSVADADKLDKTVVSAPDGNAYTYQHIGYTSASPGYVYLIGTLLFKRSGSAQFEGYSWAGQTISAQLNIRPGSPFIWDNDTKAPLMIQRSINRAGATYTTQFYDPNLPGLGFDEYGNPGRIIETGPSESGVAQSRTTSLTYFTDPAKWIINLKKDEVTDTIGSILRTFDPNGNLMSESRYGVDTGFTYTGSGDVATRTDARGNMVTYSGYKRGIPQSESHPEGVTIARVVDDAGNVTSETDGELATTTYGYDGLNRITSIGHPVGNGVTVAWTPTTRTVTRGPFTEFTTFDAFGRRTSVAHSGGPEAITQTFGHDPMGRQVFVSYPNSARGTFYRYNAADQVITVWHDAGSDGVGPTAGQAYGYVNNTVEFVNERGMEYVYRYRGWGDPGKLELMHIQAPEASASIAMQRNGMGQLTSATQDGKTREYHYDGRYFLASTVEPEVGTTSFGRDAVGNMTSRQVGAEPATTFEYDGRNRLKTVVYPAGTPAVNRTYYKDDKLASVDNGIARRDYLYDGNKNLKRETVAMDAMTFATAYDYDGNDALDRITYSSGKVVTYAPDAYGRPTQAMPYVTQVEHHPTGQARRIVMANGVQTFIELNNRKWPGTMNIGKTSTYFNMAYAYEGNGNVASITDAVDSSYARTMTYDGVDRLLTVSGPWGAGSFTYDGRGNILTQNLGAAVSLTYNYDPSSDRLASTMGTRAYAFTYDGYGNVTGNGAMTFGYNHASQMTCARCGEAGEVTYAYDGLGLRTRTVKEGAATHFVYDGNGRLLSERAADGSLKDYIYLGGKQVAVWERRRNQ